MKKNIQQFYLKTKRLIKQTKQIKIVKLKVHLKTTLTLNLLLRNQKKENKSVVINLLRK